MTYGNKIVDTATGVKFVEYAGTGAVQWSGKVVTGATAGTIKLQALAVTAGQTITIKSFSLLQYVRLNSGAYP